MNELIMIFSLGTAAAAGAVFGANRSILRRFPDPDDTYRMDFLAREKSTVVHHDGKWSVVRGTPMTPVGAFTDLRAAIDAAQDAQTEESLAEVGEPPLENPPRG